MQIKQHPAIPLTAAAAVGALIKQVFRRVAVPLGTPLSWRLRLGLAGSCRSQVVCPTAFGTALPCNPMRRP